MTASFVLNLDTTAPVISWGDPSGADLGEVLTVPYIVNEPGVESATVTLADGRVLVMRVDADALRVPLPLDTPQGNAEVRATTIDDVDNEATYALVVALTGVIPKTPPLIPAGIPRLRIPPGPTIIHDQTVVRCYESPDAIRSNVGDNATVSVRTRWTATTHTRARIRERIYTASGGMVKVRIVSGDAASHAFDGQKIIRREGPGGEDELLLLGLL